MAATTVAFVAGASGATGREIVRQLLQRPQVSKLFATARNPPPAAEYAAGLGLDASAAEKISWLAVTDTDWDQASLPAPVLDALRASSVVLTAIGTSRANQEVKDAQEASTYAKGFEQWLSRVDLGHNLRLATAAAEAGAEAFVRISSAGANSAMQGTEENPWGHYSHYQGRADEEVAKLATGAFKRGVHLMRPGRLDRGEVARSARSWEVDKHAQLGPGLSVAVVAQEAVRAAMLSTEAGVKVVLFDGKGPVNIKSEL
eukprot:TRINITY_DN93592_c0_g1_i1.p1 TRINITY_DN93592_c0_g1~~TRINITY_DN93592_c0_g1_i1.p1  ORF type:complete len:292 (-),score=55.05 TRINITY_DN93592_c0_g1_i1:79-855(-)